MPIAIVQKSGCQLFKKQEKYFYKEAAFLLKFKEKRCRKRNGTDRKFLCFDDFLQTTVVFQDIRFLKQQIYNIQCLSEKIQKAVQFSWRMQKDTCLRRSYSLRKNKTICHLSLPFFSVTGATAGTFNLLLDTCVFHIFLYTVFFQCPRLRLSRLPFRSNSWKATGPMLEFFCRKDILFPREAKKHSWNKNSEIHPWINRKLKRP